ncbi:short-chain fatty acyl-CoA regulator family protein [Hydrocarboniphaga sp.]
MGVGCTACERSACTQRAAPSLSER